MTPPTSQAPTLPTPATPLDAVAASEPTPGDGEHSSQTRRWLDRMAQAGRGEVRFGITEDGDTGMWWDPWCDGEWTMGAGDTAEEADERAMRAHPDPDADRRDPERIAPAPEPARRDQEAEAAAGGEQSGQRRGRPHGEV